MKVRIGHIPTEVTYIYAGAQKVFQAWNDTDQPEHERAYVEVIPAFCSDANNAKTIQTGKGWAESRCVIWDHETKKQVRVAQLGLKTKENELISGLRVLSLEPRYQGGQGYKVLTPDGFYFDIREDVLLDGMRTEGVAPGGILNGQYIWARVGAEMKLVRNGSDLFVALLEASERSMLHNIASKQLKVGTIYESKSGERGLFLGFVDFWDYKVAWPNGQDTSFNRREAQRAGNKIIFPTVARTFQRKQMLWFTISQGSYINEKQDPTQKLLDKSLAEEHLSYHYSLKKTHSMVKAVRDGIVIPEEIVELIRVKSENTFESNQSKKAIYYETSKPYNGKWEWLFLAEEAALAMRMVTLRVTGAPEPVIVNQTLLEMQSKLGQTLLPPEREEPTKKLMSI